MTPLLIFSFLCIAIGLAMVFWQSRNGDDVHQTFPSKQDSFAKDMLTELKGFYPDIPFEYNSSADMIAPAENYEGGRDYKFYLGNLRNRSRDMGQKDRKAYLRGMIMTFTDESEITDEELKAALYLRARTASELALRHTLLNSAEGKNSSIAAVQRGDIILETVMDMPNGVRVIDQETLKEHGLETEEAFNLAAANLLRVTPDNSDALWEKVDTDIWISKLNDDYDAARIFTFPEQMYLPFDKPATAYAPAHAILLVTSKRDEDTLDRMVKFGNNAAELHRPLSRALWGQTTAGWERLVSKKRGSVIWKASLDEDLSTYGEQKTILEQIFETEKRDIFVASVMTVQEENGDMFTLAVFIGEHGYLPVVDYVVLADNPSQKENESYKIPWSRFVDIMGPERVKAVPNLVPKRLVFKGELTHALKAELVAAAKPL